MDKPKENMLELKSTAPIANFASLGTIGGKSEDKIPHKKNVDSTNSRVRKIAIIVSTAPSFSHLSHSQEVKSIFKPCMLRNSSTEI